MIEFKNGNIIQADVEALVNTVNTVGVMGKGIALQFKQAYPANFVAYEKAAKRKEIVPGKMFVFEVQQFTHPRYIINFPTKRHWRSQARIEDIKIGLLDLVEVIRQKDIHTIAIPALGCGHGGLNWDEVHPLIISALQEVPQVMAWIYPPGNTPLTDQMPVSTRSRISFFENEKHEILFDLILLSQLMVYRW